MGVWRPRTAAELEGRNAAAEEIDRSKLMGFWVEFGIESLEIWDKEWKFWIDRSRGVCYVLCVAVRGWRQWVFCSKLVRVWLLCETGISDSMNNYLIGYLGVTKLKYPIKILCQAAVRCY